MTCVLVVLGFVVATFVVTCFVVANNPKVLKVVGQFKKLESSVKDVFDKE